MNRNTLQFSMALTLLVGLPWGARAGLLVEDLCSGDPCVISEDVDGDVGGVLTLDFGDVDVVLEAVVDLGETDLQLVAGSFAIRGDGQLRGGASLTIETDNDIVLDGTRTTGTVRMLADSPTLTLNAGGSVSVSGDLLLNADGPDSDGGTLSIDAGGGIRLTGEVEALGGNESTGGTLELTAGADVDLSGDIDLTGGGVGGGSLFITSEGGVRLGAVSLDGTGELGDGGFLEVSASGDVVFTGRVLGRGSAAAGDCGEGGSFDVTSDNGGVRFEAAIDFRGRGGDCCGGSAGIIGESVSIRAPLLFLASGGDGCGGDIAIDAPGIVCEASGAVDVSGSGSGGELTLDSRGDFSAAAGCSVDASGPDGNILAKSTGAVRIAADWRAGEDLGSGAPRGAARTFIEVRGCSIDITSSASLRSLGTDGENRLSALGDITIDGSLTAAGSNILRFPTGFQPTINGAVNPPATVIEDAELIPCDGLGTATPTTSATSTSTPAPPSATSTETPAPPTSTPTPMSTALPTSTSTPTSTALPTSSPTEMPCVCIGDCNGDCIVRISELIRAVQISLGSTSVDTCQAADRDGGGTVSIAELIAAVRSALNGCP